MEEANKVFISYIFKINTW